MKWRFVFIPTVIFGFSLLLGGDAGAVNVEDSLGLEKYAKRENSETYIERRIEYRNPSFESGEVEIQRLPGNERNEVRSFSIERRRNFLTWRPDERREFFTIGTDLRDRFWSLQPREQLMLLSMKPERRNILLSFDPPDIVFILGLEPREKSAFFGFRPQERRLLFSLPVAERYRYLSLRPSERSRYVYRETQIIEPRDVDRGESGTITYKEKSSYRSGHGPYEQREYRSYERSGPDR